jgi:L-threonylcarbamoyladenylate synthase
MKLTESSWREYGLDGVSHRNYKNRWAAERRELFQDHGGKTLRPENSCGAIGDCWKASSLNYSPLAFSYVVNDEYRQMNNNFHSPSPFQPTQREIAADAAGIAEAALVLGGGGLVAFPTETVYGLAADATSDAAVARIYSAKARPTSNPLIAHVTSLEAALEQGIFSADAMRLAGEFWPGPLTLVVPLAPGATVCAAARAGQQTVALRVPAHPVALAVIAAVGRPLAAPSANRSGLVSPVTAAHVARDFAGEIDLILDGGRCPVGLESTIVACLERPSRLLRPGGLARTDIEAVLGHALGESTAPNGLRFPGMLRSHYAPRAKLRLEAATLDEGEAGLDFGGIFGEDNNALDLSPGRDLAEAAANLFSFLRELDAREPACIAVAPIPCEDLGEAINDRLRRAAVPRPNT